MNASKPNSKNAQLFRFPEVGDRVDENPVYFCWKTEDIPEIYTLKVKDSKGDIVFETKTDKCFAIADKNLVGGNYSWNLFIEGDEMGWVDFTVAEKTVEFICPTAHDIFEKIPADVHPRHLFFKEDIAKIKANKAGELEVLKRNIKLAIEEGIPESPRFHMPAHIDDEIDYRAFFGSYRNYCDRNLVACALGHAILGDKDAGEHAKTMLLEICNWNPSGPCSINGPWRDEIGLSNSRCLSSVYDLLWDILSVQERVYVEQTIYQYGMQCKNNLLMYNFVQNPGKSHSGRVPAYLGEMAMILKGSSVSTDEELEEWLQLSIDIYGSFFPYYGGQDGGWAESVFYGSTYTKWYLPFFMAVERLSGYRFLDRPFYQRVIHFFMHFAPVGWENHPFGDGYWCTSEDLEWNGFFAQNPYRLYAQRFGPDLARDWEKQVALPEIFKLHLLDIFIDAGSPPKVHLTGEATNTYHFKTAGVMSHHTNIHKPDNDIALLARASKYGSVSHQHADQGNIAIICDGTTLITPSGYFGYEFGTAHHREWTNQTKAHNCILVDGVGQESHSYTSTGKILHCTENEDGTYNAKMDLINAYPMLKEYTREISMDNDGKITVVDEIVADKAVEISWLLHSLSSPDEKDGLLTINRKGKSVKIMPVTGLVGAPTISDQFDPAVYSDVADNIKPWMTFDDQYHMTWKSPKSDKHTIKVEFYVTR